MRRHGHSEFLGLREHGIMIFMPMWFSGVGELRDECPLASVANRSFEFQRRACRIEKGQVGDGNQNPSAVPAEISQPAIVRTHVCQADLWVSYRALPKQPPGWIEEDVLKVLALRKVQALPWVRRT